MTNGAFPVPSMTQEGLDRKDKDFLLRIPFAPEFPQKFCMPDTISHCTAEELEHKEIT